MLFIGNLLHILIFTRAGRPTFSLQKWESLDREYLKAEWKWRRSVMGTDIAAGLFTALGWFLLVPPVLTFAYIQSDGGKSYLSTHVMLVVLVVGGAMFETIEILQTLGTSSTCAWISEDFNLEDNNGWASLEIAYLSNQGSRLWIDAIDWLFLGSVLVLMHSSVANKGGSFFSPKWANLGVGIGVLCIFDFMAECARFVDWRDFMVVSAMLSVLNSLVLLPIWLLWFGTQLPAAKNFSDATSSAHLMTDPSMTSPMASEKEAGALEIPAIARASMEQNEGN